jgi:uncharacterized protein with FMN-binding domain
LDLLNEKALLAGYPAGSTFASASGGFFGVITASCLKQKKTSRKFLAFSQLLYYFNYNVLPSEVFCEVFMRRLVCGVLLLLMLMLLSTCALSPPGKSSLDVSGIPDGVYAGRASNWPNKAEVRVTVQDGRMTRIELIGHWASWIGKKAEPVIPQRIIEKQSSDVDAVTGATNSSRVIMHAVNDALEQAVKSRAEGNVGWETR